MMHKKILLPISAIAAILVGMAAFSFSPNGCSCTNVPSDYIYFSGLDGKGSIDSISAKTLEARLSAKIIGIELQPDRFPLGEKYGCKALQRSYACHSVFEKSPLLSWGFDVTYSLGDDGRVKSVSVRRFTELAP